MTTIDRLGSWHSKARHAAHFGFRVAGIIVGVFWGAGYLILQSWRSVLRGLRDGGRL